MQDERTPESGEAYEPVTDAPDAGGESQRDDAPNPETGVGVGMGSEPTSFEPEEDPEAAPGGQDEGSSTS